jgi:hypothetical protein
MRPVLAVGIVACLRLFVTLQCGDQRDRQPSVQIKRSHSAKCDALYDLAMRLDDENPTCDKISGCVCFQTEDMKKPFLTLESAISIGRGYVRRSFVGCRRLVVRRGDPTGAESDAVDGCALYPRSPFVLTKYASVLENNGKASQAESCSRGHHVSTLEPPGHGRP